MASIGNIKFEIEAALVEENEKLRKALRLSTNGLRHCSRWDISEEKANALMTQVIANEMLLTPNVEVRGASGIAAKRPSRP